MSVRVVLPSRQAQLSTQEKEQAFYWSACIESVLRRNGITDVSTASPDDNAIATATVQVYARGAIPKAYAECMLLEGPRPVEELSRLGIKATSLELESMRLTDAKGKHLGEISYQACMVRRIPKSGERSEPYPNVLQDARWANRTIRFQIFHDYPGWEPLLGMTADGITGAVGLRRKGMIVLGVPLGDLLAAGYAFPPLDAGYYQMIATPPNTEVEAAFCDLICQLADEEKISLRRVPLWPEGKKFALTIRHDCDRPVKLRDMLGLLLFYRKHRIRASFGILQNRISRIQLWLIKLFGHEVNLHSVASNADQLEEEKRGLSKLAKRPIHGFHSHGGAGSEGFLGDRHYAWAQAAGFEYAEMLGRSTRQPHAINRVIDDLPTTTRLIAPGVHFSLDGGMAPDQHYLEHISAALPEVMAQGDHMVIMSHPDIHLAELKSFIENLRLNEAWCASLADVCRWFSKTRLSNTDTTLDLGNAVAPSHHRRLSVAKGTRHSVLLPTKRITRVLAES